MFRPEFWKMFAIPIIIVCSDVLFRFTVQRHFWFPPAPPCALPAGCTDAPTCACTVVSSPALEPFDRSSVHSTSSIMVFISDWLLFFFNIRTQKHLGTTLSRSPKNHFEEYLPIKRGRRASTCGPIVRKFVNYESGLFLLKFNFDWSQYGHVKKWQ